MTIRFLQCFLWQLLPYAKVFFHLPRVETLYGRDAQSTGQQLTFIYVVKKHDEIKLSKNHKEKRTLLQFTVKNSKMIFCVAVNCKKEMKWRLESISFQEISQLRPQKQGKTDFWILKIIHFFVKSLSLINIWFSQVKKRHKHDVLPTCQDFLIITNKI